MPTGLLLNMAGPLRSALIEMPGIASRVSEWKGEPAVFTRRPIPGEADYPLLAISPDVAIGAADGLISRRPVVLRDLVAYGRQPDDYRVVEELGYLLREAFHLNRFAISPPGYHVIEIMASGPFVAPTDDESIVGRVVALTIQLEALAS